MFFRGEMHSKAFYVLMRCLVSSPVKLKAKWHHLPLPSFLPYLTDNAGPCCCVPYWLCSEGGLWQNGRHLPDHGWPQDFWQRYSTRCLGAPSFVKLPVSSFMGPLSSRYCVEHRPGWNAGAAESDAECRPDYPLCWAEKGEQGSPRQRGLQGCFFTIIHLWTCVSSTIVLSYSSCFYFPSLRLSASASGFLFFWYPHFPTVGLDYFWFVLLYPSRVSISHTAFLLSCRTVWMSMTTRSHCRVRSKNPSNSTGGNTLCPTSTLRLERYSPYLCMLCCVCW